MFVYNKIKSFVCMSSTTKKLLIEAFLFLGWARILKFLPFAKISPTLGEHMSETSYQEVTSNKKQLKSIASAIHIMNRYTFWESKCLVQAIAAMKMLERRGIESTIYFGTARDNKGELIAHAWLRSGSFYLTGYCGMERFTVVSKFAKKT